MGTLDSTRAFLGMVGNLREFSVLWEGKELGATLKRAAEVAGGRLVAGGGIASPDECAGGPPVITSVKVGGTKYVLVRNSYFCPGKRVDVFRLLFLPPLVILNMGYISFF